MALFCALACRPESASPPRAPAERPPAHVTAAPAAPAASAPPAVVEEPSRTSAPTPPPDLPQEFEYLVLSDGPSVDEKGCVRDIAKHSAEIGLKKYRAEIKEHVEHEPSLADFTDPKCIYAHDMGDLDGDGESDSDVATCLTGGNLTWTHFLYFSNRGCKKPVGEIGSGEIIARESKSRGVKDLDAHGSNGCAGRDFWWGLYRFGGKSYILVDEATCYLCSGEKPPPGANRHPVCKRQAAIYKEDEEDTGPPPLIPP